MGRGDPKPLFAAVFLASMPCVPGCSTEANVHLKDGSTVQGEIVNSTRDKLKLDAAATEVVVPRASVASVDHPGNVAAWVGGSSILPGLGLVVSAVVILGRCGSGKDGSICRAVSGGLFGGGGALVVAGAIPLVWGLLTWTGSTDAAEVAEDDEARIAPIINLAPEAASLSWGF